MTTSWELQPHCNVWHCRIPVYRTIQHQVLKTLNMILSSPLSQPSPSTGSIDLTYQQRLSASVYGNTVTWWTAGDCVWNVMAHEQKPVFVFRRNGRVHLNRRGCQSSRLLAAEVCISGSNAGYTTFRGSVKSTGYPLHSSVSPSLPRPCVTVCHHISNELLLHSNLEHILLHRVWNLVVDTEGGT
jgi:hypothetical protein